jgi:hypothetical protein
MVSWVGVPLVDRLPIPLLTRLLGRRRSWLPQRNHRGARRHGADGPARR